MKDENTADGQNDRDAGKIVRKELMNIIFNYIHTKRVKTTVCVWEPFMDPNKLVGAT